MATSNTKAEMEMIERNSRDQNTMMYEPHIETDFTMLGVNWSEPRFSLRYLIMTIIMSGIVGAVAIVFIIPECRQKFDTNPQCNTSTTTVNKTVPRPNTDNSTTVKKTVQNPDSPSTGTATTVPCPSTVPSPTLETDRDVTRMQRYLYKSLPDCQPKPIKVKIAGELAATDELFGEDLTPQEMVVKRCVKAYARCWWGKWCLPTDIDDVPVNVTYFKNDQDGVLVTRNATRNVSQHLKCSCGKET